MSLRGRGMYCKVKLLGENTSEVRERQEVRVRKETEKERRWRGRRQGNKGDRER
jgi:hypothetical protein